MEQPTPEFLALKQAFPITTVYGCDFHREQARAQVTSYSLSTPVSSTPGSSTPVSSTVVLSTQHFYFYLLLFVALLLNFDLPRIYMPLLKFWEYCTDINYDVQGTVHVGTLQGKCFGPE